MTTNKALTETGPTEWSTVLFNTLQDGIYRVEFWSGEVLNISRLTAWYMGKEIKRMQR
jgi:hypothetical protein